MSNVNNPYKLGDRVVDGRTMRQTVYGVQNFIGTVKATYGEYVHVQERPFEECSIWHWSNLCAAIKGVDYDVLGTQRDDNLPLQPSGHLADGSSIQKHSAGGVYPVVIWHRDKKLPGAGKYDVGLTWPDQAEPVWFRDYDTAISVAEAIKRGLT